jgi:hypothetical protein
MSGVRYDGLSLEKLYLCADSDSNRNTLEERLRHCQVTSVKTEVLDASFSHDRIEFHFSGSIEGIPWGSTQYLCHFGIAGDGRTFSHWEADDDYFAWWSKQRRIFGHRR